MSFLSPLTLLALIPLGGAIVLLYLLRVKRQDVTVSSVMLWQMAMADTQANAPFQKLKRSLLLLLQLLTILALIAALARPFIWSAGLGGKATVLILDASASMNATDIGGGRFAEAVRLGRQIVAKKEAGDAVGIVLAGQKPVLLSPLTTDRDKLQRAFDTVQATDIPTDMREAILLAATLVQSRGAATINVLTDGDFGRLDEMALGGAALGFTIVGKGSRNVGITAFDVRDTLGGGSGRQAFVTVQNFGKSDATVPLEIRDNDTLIDAHEVSLRPGEQKSEVFDNLKADDGGIVQAKLAKDDDLTADNIASVTIAPRRKRKILLVSSGNPFFERVLTTDAQIEINEVAPADFKSTDAKSYDAAIFDDTPPPKDLPAGRYLFWGAKALNGPLVPATATATSEAERPVLLDWSRTHPLMRFVDLANTNILRAKTVAPAPWATTLAEADSGPIITAGETGDTRSVFVAFTLTESDMPLRVAFPIFLTNCIDYLTARPGDNGGVTRPGEVVALAARPEAGPLTITTPDGRSDTVLNAPGSPPLYEKTRRVGAYRANGKNFEQYFVVSLLSPTESSTQPVQHPSVVVTDADTKGDKKPSNQAAVTVAETRTRAEWWPYVAAAALVFLLLEWYVYHRRIG